MSAEVDDAGLQAGENVELAAELAGAIDLHFDGAARLLLYVVSKPQQHLIQGVVAGVGHGQFENVSRRLGKAFAREVGQRNGLTRGEGCCLEKGASTDHSIPPG